MKKSLILSSGIVLSAFLFTGCATIISGDTQNINLQSKKEQTVSIDGKMYTSPSVVSVKRTNKDAVLKAVNLGHDTDTTGAVTGGLAALIYGLDNIPKEWINTLARKDDIINLTKCL